jgi:hypothetical protein
LPDPPDGDDAGTGATRPGASFTTPVEAATTGRETPLTVGSPQQVVDKTLTFREDFGDYQRQLFNVDGAGVPLKTGLEQLDILGEEVLPELRREFARNRPTGVPDAPTHASLLAARAAGEASAAATG